MAVTGAIKFFERSKLLATDGATAEFQTAPITNPTNFTPLENVSVNNLLTFDRNAYFRWTQQNANLFTLYKVIVRMPRPQTVNRLLVLDTNLVFATDDKLKLGNSQINLSNLSDIDNVNVSFIQSAVPNRRSSYYEFDEVTADNFEFQFYLGAGQNNGILTPYMRQIILTREIGTFVGFPSISGYSENQNEIINMTSTGLKHITKQENTVDSFRIMFKAHPIQNDIDIADKLYDSRESFTLWPCGGGYGSNHFLFEKEGWNLDSVYNVQTTGKKSNRWYKNFYKSGISSKINLVESL